jgi:hypothetical protein
VEIPAEKATIMTIVSYRRTLSKIGLRYTLEIQNTQGLKKLNLK